MVVREGLDYFPGCIWPTYGNAWQYRPHCKWLSGCTGSRCITRKTQRLFSGTSTRSPFNTERRRPTLAAFSKTRIQKTSFKYWYPRVACRCHLRFIFNLFSNIRNLLNRHLADPKVDDSSQCSRPFYSMRSSEVDMLCFRSVMLVRSFTANKISGTRPKPLFHAICNVFVFVLVLPPIEMICKMCCPTSDIHSTVGLEYAI